MVIFLDGIRLFFLMQEDLKDHGIHARVYRIKRLRKQMSLRCKQVKKFKATTNSNHTLPLAPNLLNQKFQVSTLNQAWVTDISYISQDGDEKRRSNK